MSAEALEKRFSDLQDRLAALQDSTNQLKELISRLANFDFQPGSIPLDAAQDDNVGSELSGEINQILREQEEDLELLQEEVLDIRPSKSDSEQQHERDRLKDGAKRLEQELKSCRVSFRKAQVAAKRNLELVQRQERALLYASFASPRSGASSPPGDAPSQQPQPGQQLQQQTRRKHRMGEQSKEEREVQASNDVTLALRRTHDMMAAELSRSDFAQRMLDESKEALKGLSDNYSNLDTLLSSSRDLLGTLLKSQKSDTWYLETSFAILVATVGWLIFRRWIYGPAWWLIWLPLKLIFRTGAAVTSAVGSQGGGSGDGVKDPLASQPGSPSARMNNKGVPTVQVDGSAQPSAGNSEEGTMVEEVGKIIDESKTGEHVRISKDGVVSEGTDEAGTAHTEGGPSVDGSIPESVPGAESPGHRDEL